MASSYTGYSSEVISRITRPPVRRRKSRTSAWVASAVRLPTTRLTTNRLSGSSATWSQQSPHRASSVAVLLLFGDERPLLVELHLVGLRGKTRPTRRGVRRRGRPRVGYTG